MQSISAIAKDFKGSCKFSGALLKPRPYVQFSSVQCSNKLNWKRKGKAAYSLCIFEDKPVWSYLEKTNSAMCIIFFSKPLSGSLQAWLHSPVTRYGVLVGDPGLLELLICWSCNPIEPTPRQGRSPPKGISVQHPTSLSWAAACRETSTNNTKSTVKIITPKA